MPLQPQHQQPTTACLKQKLRTFMPELELDELSVRRKEGVWNDALEAGAVDPSALRGCSTIG